MENVEEMQQILDRFARLKQKEIPKELDQYMRHVAQTGDILFPWVNVKYLLREKLLSVIKQFYDASPNLEDIPQYPNVDPFNYESMKSSLLERLDSFTAAPFTIQRLYELLMEPRKQYNRIDKFMRALEKNILVVSTIETNRRRTEVENGNSLDSIVNDDLSLDVNVDIDLENENVFNIETPSGTGAGVSANGAIIATSPTLSIERKEKHGIDDENLPSPKKLKLDNAVNDDEKLLEKTNTEIEVANAADLIDKKECEIKPKVSDITKETIVETVTALSTETNVEHKNEIVHETEKTTNSSIAAKTETLEQTKENPKVEVEIKDIKKDIELKEVAETKIIDANGAHEYKNKDDKESIQKAAETDIEKLVPESAIELKEEQLLNAENAKDTKDAAAADASTVAAADTSTVAAADASTVAAAVAVTAATATDVAVKAAEDDIDEKLEAELLGEISNDVTERLTENIGQSDDIIDAKLEAELLGEIAVVDEQLKSNVMPSIDTATSDITLVATADAVAAITTTTTATTATTNDAAIPIESAIASTAPIVSEVHSNAPVVEKTENVKHKIITASVPANINQNANEADTTVELSISSQIPAVLPPAIEILDSIDDDEVAAATDEQQIIPTIPILNEQPMDIVPLDITNALVDEVIMSETAKDDSPSMDVDDTSQEEAMDQ